MSGCSVRSEPMAGEARGAAVPCPLRLLPPRPRTTAASLVLRWTGPLVLVLLPAAAAQADSAGPANETHAASPPCPSAAAVANATAAQVDVELDNFKFYMNGCRDGGCYSGLLGALAILAIVGLLLLNLEILWKLRDIRFALAIYEFLLSAYVVIELVLLWPCEFGRRAFTSPEADGDDVHGSRRHVNLRGGYLMRKETFVNSDKGYLSRRLRSLRTLVAQSMKLGTDDANVFQQEVVRTIDRAVKPNTGASTKQDEKTN